MLSLFLISLLPLSFAQANEAFNDEDFFNLSLEELMMIEITSRKRTESLNQIPAAFTAYRPEQLDILPASRFEQVHYRIPGLVSNADNPIEPNLFMRGAGSDIESASANSSVGFFLEGMYLPRGTGYQLSLHDMQQVEILKGPQGVLYGKNVSGGVINYVSNKANQTQSRKAEFVLGEDEKIQLTAVANQPINEDIAVRVSLNVDQQQGYAYNEFTGSDMDDDKHWSIKTKLNWQLDAQSALDVMLLLQADDSNGPWVDIKIPSDHNQAFKNPNPRRGKNNVEGVIDNQIKALFVQYSRQFDDIKFNANTSLVNGDFTYSNNDAGSYIDFASLAKTPTGLVDFNHPNFDASQLNDDFYLNNKAEQVDSFAQEMLFAIDGDIDWLWGGYFLAEKVERIEQPEYFFATFQSQGSETSDSESDNQTLGLFVDLTYAINTDLTLQTALRYTQDKKEFSLYRAVSNDPLGAPLQDRHGMPTNAFSVSDDKTWSAWTPSASLNWQYEDNLLFYAAYSRGFRSGGWNGENTTSPQQARYAYDEEFADNLELGLRHHSLDQRLFTQLNLFWTEYEDLQTQQLTQVEGSDTPDNLIANASGARVAGIEIETAYELTASSTLIFLYAFMDSEINESMWQANRQYNADCDCSMTTEIDLKGNQLRRTPEHSASVDLNLRLYDASHGTLDWLTHYAYTSEYFLDNDNNLRTEVSSIEMLDTRLKYQPHHGHWYLQLWLKNALDEQVAMGVTDVLDSVLVTYTPPRTAGVTFGYRW